VDRDALLRKLEEVEATLRGVKVPGFDVDVVSSGVIQKLRISSDGERLAIFVSFTASDPRCGFCKFINHTIWSSIAREIKGALTGMGFREVIVVDIDTGSQLA